VSVEALTALTRVTPIDIVPAEDKAIAVGMAENGLPAAHRGEAILVRIAAATVLRISFARVASHLMGIIDLLLAGGTLLLWVPRKLRNELHASTRGELVLEAAKTTAGVPN